MRTAVPTVPLQFESEPPGAEVRTSGGQTCKTPCALAVPAADMQVTYNLNGYQPQTVPVKLVPPEPGDFGSAAAAFHSEPGDRRIGEGAPRAAEEIAGQGRQASATAYLRADVEPGDGGFAPPPQTSGFNAPPPPATGSNDRRRRIQRLLSAAGGAAPAASAWPAPNQTR